VLYDKRMQHGWKYGDHYLPHDIKVREWTSGKSRLSSLAALGIEAVVVPDVSVLDGISITRKMLGRTIIDPDRCERGLEALRQYRREFNDKLKDWAKNPLHDWTSHAADALRMFAVGFDDLTQAKPQKRDTLDNKPKGSHWSA